MTGYCIENPAFCPNQSSPSSTTSVSSAKWNNTFFCDSEKSAEKLEALEAQKEESANFLQAQDMENIIH